MAKIFSGNAKGALNFFNGKDGLYERIKNTVFHLKQLQTYMEENHLTNVDENTDVDLNKLYHLFENIKNVQGNIHNDITRVACLMSKEYLRDEFKEKLKDFDVLGSSVNANGFDIKAETEDGKTIIGEVKTTIPAKKDNTLGSQQHDSVSKDLNGLWDAKKKGEDEIKEELIAGRFMFVTNKYTSDDINDKYKELLGKISLVLLGEQEKNS